MTRKQARRFARVMADLSAIESEHMALAWKDQSDGGTVSPQYHGRVAALADSTRISVSAFLIAAQVYGEDTEAKWALSWNPHAELNEVEA